ncbi:alpha-galactosidase [Paenibacillus campinasensis]|uniref:Alpha-galactosidase n=1 Tax=Paenibacillus campinasensis TaxID=66347 RepID=A0ABW9SVU2_9BACL|nr:alpha-galactosidase [Paenibacillus campinasensis]MUG65103.1 alpha-galactosidase [Paenibacillus campinasensis]
MINRNDIAVKVEIQAGERVRLSSGRVTFEADLKKGEYAYAGGVYTLSGVHSGFRWNGREYHTGQYDRHLLAGDPAPIRDGFGEGVHLTIRHESELLPGMEQHFYVYNDAPYLLTRVVVSGDAGFKLNRISVVRTQSIAAEAEEEASAEALHVLRVPYDNDKWVRYVTDTAPLELQSYEVTALYQPGSRQGLILGSVSHDVWKTGIRVKGETIGKLDELNLFAGAADTMTRDEQPHGYVKGPRVESPLVFIGSYDDYRRGLEEYGQANTVVAPPLAWDGGVPFGWNSWSAAMTTLDYELYTSTSDFLKEEAQSQGFQNEGTLYINFDAFWDRLTQEEMEDALRRVRANGHRPGTYWTPFAFWGSPAQFGNPVEGTDGKYTYGDILLRDHEGEVVPDIAGGLAIDPTHPGNLARIDWYTNKFIREGFEYIKLDFMAHGALEGKHYNPNITTGIAAYNYGLAYLVERLSPKRTGRPFFINLSIAPLFPYAYAHSRRISCDVFGQIQDTEYLLNSLTHGWWMNGSLYRFNDPDHAVIYKSFNQDSTTREEGRSRLTASLIAGTVLLLGDDFRHEEAALRAREWLGNREVMEVARYGRTFVPVESGKGDRAADTFMLEHPNEKGAVYFAVFNFDKDQSREVTVSLSRAGLDPDRIYIARDLWEGTEHEVSGDWAAELAPAASTIFRLYPQ